MNHVELEAPASGTGAETETAPALLDQARTTAEAMAAAERTYSEMMASGFEQASHKYGHAQQTYSAELQALYAELTERSQLAYKAYAESLNAAYTSAPSFEAYNQEYRNYLECLQQLYGGGDLAQRTQRAYDNYAKRVSAHPAPGPAGDAAESLKRELADIWGQQHLRQELQAAQERYLAQVERLGADVHERQVQAYRELLASLGDIWSKPDLATRTQGALNRFVGAVRDVVIDCHAHVEKSSAKAVEVLADGKPKFG